MFKPKHQLLPRKEEEPEGGGKGGRVSFMTQEYGMLGDSLTSNAYFSSKLLRNLQAQMQQVQVGVSASRMMGVRLFQLYNRHLDAIMPEVDYAKCAAVPDAADPRYSVVAHV